MLLQDVEDLRQTLEKGESRIQAYRSVSDQNIALLKAESRTRIDWLQEKVSRMEHIFRHDIRKGCANASGDIPRTFTEIGFLEG